MRGRQAVERLTVLGLARPAPEGVATPIVRPGSADRRRIAA